MDHFHDIGVGSWEAPNIAETRKARRRNESAAISAGAQSRLDARLEEGNNSQEFISSGTIPALCTSKSQAVGRLQASQQPMSWIVGRLQGGSLGVERKLWFDVRKSDFLDRRFLVSRKRNIQLSDLIGAWKHSVLKTFLEEERPLEGNMDIWST
jgi:hypothetical protein